MASTCEKTQKDQKGVQNDQEKMENKKVMQNNFTGMKIGCKKLQILQK